MPLGERETYMGETLFSKNTPDGRVYEWGDTEMVSVTTILKNGIAKPGLVNWAAKTVAGLAVKMQKADDGTLQQLDESTLMESFGSSRNSASSIGNVVHSIAEKISKNEQVDIEALDEGIKPYVDAFMKFIEDWSPEFIESEAFVANKAMGYAGTLDAIVKIKDTQYILDIKTGKSIYPEVGLQLAAYARAEFIGRVGGAEEPLPQINMNRGLVLHLRPNKYSLYDVRIDAEIFDAFLAALDIHHYDADLRHYIIGPRMLPESQQKNGETKIGE